MPIARSPTNFASSTIKLDPLPTAMGGLTPWTLTMPTFFTNPLLSPFTISTAEE